MFRLRLFVSSCLGAQSEMGKRSRSWISVKFAGLRRLYTSVPSIPQAAVTSFAHAVTSTKAEAAPKPEKSCQPSHGVGPSIVRKTVKTLVEDFQWANDNFDAIEAMLVENKEDGLLHWGTPSGPIMGGLMTTEELYAKAIKGKTLSMGYAGVDAPGAALLQSFVAMMDRSETPLDVSKPQVLWAIEMNKHCQLELKTRVGFKYFLISDSKHCSAPF